MEYFIKFRKINGSERTLEKTTVHLHCVLRLSANVKFEGITWNYLVTISNSLLSDVFTLKCIISLLDEYFSLNVGAMDF